MSQVQQEVEPLVAGDVLTWEEFERRWDATPEIKRAELIWGMVYIMSPISLPHGKTGFDVGAWLCLYAASTPGCEGAIAATWRMLGDAPQPDAHLRIIEECGGKSRVVGNYAAGAPELAVEVCHSSVAYDLHQKMDLYLRAGVDEYITVLLHEREVRWHRWRQEGYAVVAPDAEGLIRSAIFPGLWLDVPALLDGNMARVLEVLQRGLQAPEHAAFAQTLAQRKAQH